MITIFGMKTCPDCTYLEPQIEGDERFRTVDIGEDVKNLKEFLRIRDVVPAFDEVRGTGSVGIPCIVLEDGRVTLDPADAGLTPRPETGTACRLDGKGC